MSSVVALKRPHPTLPSAVTLPHKEGAPEYTRPGQFAARLGIDFDPLFVDGTRDRPLDFNVPALSLRGDISAERMTGRRDLLDTLDEARRIAEQSPAIHDFTIHQQRAFTLLASQRTHVPCARGWYSGRVVPQLHR